MVSSFFQNSIYVRVARNGLRVRHIEWNREGTFLASPPFTTQRLLVGEFTTAESLLKRALKEVSTRGFLSAAPHVLIQPLEMIEGGLSEVEERVLRELAIGGARASKVVVWVGEQLDDAAVKAKLYDR